MGRRIGGHMSTDTWSAWAHEQYRAWVAYATACGMGEADGCIWDADSMAEWANAEIDAAIVSGSASDMEIHGVSADMARWARARR